MSPFDQAGVVQCETRRARRPRGSAATPVALTATPSHAYPLPSQATGRRPT